jgi:hypothetical protein
MKQFNQGDVVKCNICGVTKTVDAQRQSDAGMAYQVLYFKDGSLCPLPEECVTIQAAKVKVKK